MASANLTLEELKAVLSEMQQNEDETKAKQARIKRLSMLEFGDITGGMFQPSAADRDARMVSLGMYALGKIQPPR